MTEEAEHFTLKTAEELQAKRLAAKIDPIEALSLLRNLADGDTVGYMDHAAIKWAIDRLTAPPSASSREADNEHRKTAEREAFWVLERFVDGKSQGYWNGGSSRSFIPNINEAIQFRRRQDAMPIWSSWHWTDVEVVEHVMVHAAHSHGRNRL